MLRLPPLSPGACWCVGAWLALSACAPPSPPAIQVTTPRRSPGATTEVELARYGPDHVGVQLPGLDICKKNDDGSLAKPIAAGTYRGLLRNAACEQQVYITMSRVAQALDVDCTFCHVPDPDDPKKALYAEPTDRKARANWMLETFVQGLRPVDGSPTTCSSCHGAEGAPRAKILQTPRDDAFAQEWMHEVMTTRFVTAEGDRLRCKTCHQGMAPGSTGWSPTVIREVRWKAGQLRRGPPPAASAPAATTDAGDDAPPPEPGDPP